MLISVKVVFPEWTFFVISYVVPFAIDILECVRAWFILFSFKSRWVDFRVSFITSCYVSMVFEFMRATTFLTF